VLLARMGSRARDGGIRAADAGIVELFGGLSARQFAKLVGQLQRREPTRRSGDSPGISGLQGRLAETRPTPTPLTGRPFAMA
jgi:hypothetical protein